MRYRLLAFLTILLMTEFTLGQECSKNKYSYPPEWGVGDSWVTKSTRVRFWGGPLRENESPFRQDGWRLHRFSVIDIKESKGEKTYKIEVEEIPQEEYPTRYPPGTRIYLYIGEGFVLKSIDRLAPTKEESKSPFGWRGTYRKSLYAKNGKQKVREYETPTVQRGYYGHIGVPLVFPVICQVPMFERELFDLTVRLSRGYSKVRQVVTLDPDSSGFTVNLSFGKEVTLTWVHGDPWWSSMEVKEGSYHCVSELMR
jgi:hypothetical protein